MKNMGHKVHLYKILLLLVIIPAIAVAGTPKTKKKRSSARITAAEAKEATHRLSEMGYWVGPGDGSTKQALIAFQKVEGKKVTGRLTRDDLEAIRNASKPQPKDAGYRHVEVDLDRQVLFMIDEDGEVSRILPVSTGSGRHYSEKGMSGTAYTPRGRFKVYGKATGWKKSPLGLLYYPNYFSDGIAIHGNPSVPTSPESHGCIRIPMFASVSVFKKMPVGTIVLVYDKDSFVSAKEWVVEGEKDQQVGSGSAQVSPK
jgi:lipoprotein-anchoring transpeptidase ErfK/SrfK